MSRVEFDDPEVTIQRLPDGFIRQWKLFLQLEDDAGRREIPVTEDVTIGSAQDVPLRVASPTVSRLHARIELRTDGAWIVDLGSTNGTAIDGLSVGSARLRDGVRIQLGEASLGVRFERERERVELWPEGHFGPLVGVSPAMRALFVRLDRIARSDANVLVLGETGTGKDLVAHAIHEASARREGPFVVVDCGAIPETLFEAELFGHARGAFTGAEKAREGAFGAAHGGTLFLDEVGELPLSVQPKLLRALETRTARRVGEHTHRPVDVRIVAATHRDLARLVSAGAFREDLYFRLAVLPVHVPALRDRKEDIEALVRHFLGGESLDARAMKEVRGQPWLGNVRELRNFVERAAALGASEALQSMTPLSRGGESEVLPEVDVHEPFKDVRERWLNHLERTYLLRWLEEKRWNVSAVAEAMGMDRTYIHRLMRKHGLGR